MKKNILLASALVCDLVGTQARAQVIQDFNHPFSLPSAPQPQTYQTYNNGFGASTTYGSNGFVAQTLAMGLAAAPLTCSPAIVAGEDRN
jgi:hypothetical protein